MEERKKAARQARKAANEAKSLSYKGLYNWRQVGGGAKFLVDEVYDPEKEEQERLKIEMIDKMYQEALARKMQKVQEHSMKEIEEFEKAIRMVKKQIELQQIKAAKLRRKMRVKTEKAGVLICGDLIEKVVVSDAPQMKQTVNMYAEKMDSIVTIKIEAGESAQVVMRGLNEPPRVERGPQVLILSSSEQLVATTFELNSRNASFKPEFNWSITPTTDSLSSPASFSYSLPYDTYSPSPSFSYSPSFSHSFSFDEPSISSPSLRYDLPGAFDTTPKYSFSFETDDASQRGNFYSFEDTTSQNGNRFSFDDESTEPQYSFVVQSDEADYAYTEDTEDAKGTLEKRLVQLSEALTECNRITSLVDAGFMEMPEFQRKLAELYESVQLSSEANLEMEINQIQQKLEVLKTTKAKENAPSPTTREPKVRKEAGGGGERGREGARGGARGGMERGRGGGVERGGRPGRISGPPVRGRGGARGGMERGRGMMRGGGRGRGGVPSRGGREGGGRGPRPPRQIALDDDDIDVASVSEMGDDTESVMSEDPAQNGAFGAKYSRESSLRDDVKKCQTLLQYLRRFLSPEQLQENVKLRNYIQGNFSKESENGDAAEEEREGGGHENGNENGNGHENGIEYASEGEGKGKGKGKGKEKEKDKGKEKRKDDYDYLSNDLFLTDDEDGYFYEKVLESNNPRKNKKKTQPKEEKMLFIPVDKCLIFAEIGLFPPRKLFSLQRSIDDICNKCKSYHNELQNILAEKRRKEEERERRRQKAREEKEKAEASPWMAQLKPEEEEKGEKEEGEEDEDEDEEGSGGSRSNAEEEEEDEGDKEENGEEEFGGEEEAGANTGWGEEEGKEGDDDDSFTMSLFD